MKRNEIFGYCDFDIFYAWAASAYSTGVFVEVGVFLGRSLYQLAYHTKDKDIKVYGVDYWPKGKTIKFKKKENFPKDLLTWDQVYDKAVDNLKEFDHVTLIRKDSSEASKMFEDGSVEFIFLDGSHTYEGVKKDLKSWFPKLKENGVIAGHDYKNGHPGVEQAVNEFFGNKAKISAYNSVWRFTNESN